MIGRRGFLRAALIGGVGAAVGRSYFDIGASWQRAIPLQFHRDAFALAMEPLKVGMFVVRSHSGLWEIATKDSRGFLGIYDGSHVITQGEVMGIRSLAPEYDRTVVGA